VQRPAGNHPFRAGDRAGLPPDDGDPCPEGREQAGQGLGDPAAAQDGDGLVVERGTALRTPVICADAVVDPAQPGQREGKGVLSHGLGVGTLGTCPDAAVGE